MSATAQPTTFDVPISELNRIFADGDAKLPEALKQQYPVRPWAEIEREFPNEWVAVIVTRMQGTNPIADARIFAHSPKRREFMRLVDELRHRYGRLHWTRTFTGREMPLSTFSDDD
jgi:hypothetical protein